MSEFIDREKAIANIKAAYCCGCEHYNGVRCRACQIMDAMDVLEDEPAVVPDVQRWRKTAEEPPTEADANDCEMVLAGSLPATRNRPSRTTRAFSKAEGPSILKQSTPTVTG